MLVHCAMHPVCYALLTWPYLREAWIHIHGLAVPGWACILVVFAGHFVEDEWRVFTILKYNMPDNSLYFFWDQLIHYIFIFAISPIPGAATRARSSPRPGRLLGCLFVLVTHACTVLVYFVEKDLYGRPFPSSREKYTGICRAAGPRRAAAHFESRLACAGSGLGVAGGDAGSAPLARAGALPLGFGLGAAVAVAGGVLARLICYGAA